MTLTLTTAGESHGPALVAIVTGLPAGLLLERERIEGDLRRRQQGYGRSPRQQIETDEVEVLAGLRHGRTLGTPLALVVRNRDHKNWTWGMSPWPPEGEPSGKGKDAVTLPRPGPRRPRRGHEVRARRRPRTRSSARAPGTRRRSSRPAARAKALLREIDVEVESSVATEELEAKIDAARGPTATRSAASSRCARAASRPGSAPTRRRRSGSTRASPGRSWARRR